MAERVGFAPRHYFSSLVFARLLLYFSHFYYFFVAITPGLQTTVSSVVWSACFCCCLLYCLQADSQPVRIPQLTKKNSETRYVSPNFLAERVGFAPRRYFSSLVFARLLLYFSHSYYFFIAITRKEIHLHSKDENGIQPFPASGSPTAGFSIALKCERRQQVAALLYPDIFPPKQKDAYVLK